MRVSVVCFVVLCGLGAAMPGRGQTVGCTLKSQVYTCDRAEFRPVLAAASTVRVETGPRDRVANSKLRDLVGTLGKTRAGEEGKADLVFSLVPLDSDGVLIGPAGTELAVLRIYGPPRDGQRGNLVWAETFYGQPDMSWPATVQAVIEQFKSGFKRTS